MTTNDFAGLEVTDLRPCILLALDVSRSGGQSYTREGETVERLVDGSVQSVWTTKKLTQNEDEFAEAARLQGQAKREGAKLGRHLPVGIVISLEKRAEVKAYRREWQKKVAEFNGRSKHTKINFTCMIFKVTGENVKSLELVLDELRNGLNELQAAYASLEPTAIRAVVQKMAGFTDILPERVGAVIETAIDEARERASKISRSEKKLSRIERKIAEELNEEDIDTALDKFSSQRLTASLKLRVNKIRALADEKQSAIDTLDAVRRQVNEAPIKLARFAVRRPGVEVGEDKSGELNAARVAARFASTPAA